MTFCINCGQELVEGAKFCACCGKAVNDSNSTSQRKIVYDGEIHKCPSCGEMLESFTVNCPSCGYEIRNRRATSSIQELSYKLEEIEKKREYEEPPKGFFAFAEYKQRISKADEQKINLIKNFSIPNSKEDILEFMILATSNINMSMYSSTDEPTATEKALNEAWNAKIKQVYVKARSIYNADADFMRIQELYDSCFSDIKKQKKKKVLKWSLRIGWIPLLIAVPVIYLLITNPKEEVKEIKRLEAIVIDVQEALSSKEYKHALRIADTIDYQRYDTEAERKWDIERERWVDKVIDEAERNGIKLEYTPTPDIDNATN